MNFKIVPIHSFLKELKYLSKKHVSLKEDLKNLEVELTQNPKMGDSIGKDCYKVRLKITSKGKGKSGGGRVITHLIVNVTDETLYLLKIYDKSEQSAVNEAEIKQLLASINR